MTHSHRSSTRTALLAGIAALVLGAGTVATTAPAEAFGGHGGGFGGGASFHRAMGGGFGGGLNRGGLGAGFNRGGVGGGFGRVGVAHGGLRGRGLGLAGLGLGVAAAGAYGAYAGDGYAEAGDGYAENDGAGFGDDAGCIRTVLTADGYRTVNVCN